MMEISPLQSFFIPKFSQVQFGWHSSNINTITLVWLTVLYKLLFFFKALWSSCKALNHRTRSVSLSVSINCVSDSPGGVIWDAVTCHRQHTSHISACTYKENCRTCLIFYSKKQETRNKMQLFKHCDKIEELTLKMHFNSFLLACITSACSTLLTENSPSLIQEKKEENGFHVKVLAIVVFLNRIPQSTTKEVTKTAFL